MYDEDMVAAAPTLDEVLRLIAHLPVDRWSGLATHLRSTADARWFSKGATVVEDSANGVMLSTAHSRVRLAADAREGAAQVELLVAKLRR